MQFLKNIRYTSSKVFANFKNLNVINQNNGVYKIELNRPEHRNAFTFRLWQELHEAFNLLSECSNCRSIVISGNGKSFCAGIDLKNGITELFNALNDNSLDVARKSRKVRQFIEVCQNSYTAVEKCSKPVIAAIHGHCIGAGINLVGCCDIRYAVNNTIFSIKEVDIGIAADVGILQRIQKIVGNDSWAREIAFTAKTFNGSEAFDKGFLSRVYGSTEECLQAALALATEISNKSPIAVQGTKLAMNFARSHGVDDSLEWMKTWNQSQLQTEDILKNLKSIEMKEKPKFNDV